ncbi:hypothetical protein [Paenibacillus stellifer]|uniref:hypothetical protein n=1 Tax=Paenibacillus stellifer TaxID=169760 RepID=UPI00147050F3|nr:hypothetical protein [Paenibacillus stellifer]
MIIGRVHFELCLEGGFGQMVNIESISVLHDILGYAKPKHPLITLIDYNAVNPRDPYYNVSFKLNLFEK